MKCGVTVRSEEVKLGGCTYAYDSSEQPSKRNTRGKLIVVAGSLLEIASDVVVIVTIKLVSVTDTDNRFRTLTSLMFNLLYQLLISTLWF